jgi:hypothetical protein
MFEGKFLRHWGRTYKHVRFRYTSIAVHRLVAMAFCNHQKVPWYQKKLVVNHIDGNKRNNRASNLEYCSKAENVRHAHRTGLISYRRRGARV